MYKTTHVLYKHADGSLKTSINSSVLSGSGSSDKLSVKISPGPDVFTGKKQLSECSEYGGSMRGLKRFFANVLYLIVFLPLCIVILLWIVALILDGPNHIKSCVIVWPLFTGLLIVAFLYVLIRCYVYCKSEKTCEEEEISMVNKDQFSDHGQAEYYQPEGKYVLYKQHFCITVSYGFLIFSMICIMIVSVIQFFSLEYNCSKDFKTAMEEVFLGYEILVYLSIVVLSILGCLLTCLMFAILVNCFTRDRHTATV